VPIETLTKKLKRLSIVFRVLISLVILAFLYFSIDDMEGLVSLLASITVADILVFIALASGRNLIAAIRFRCLFDLKKVSTLELIRHYFIAAIFNTILPTALGGDGVRAIMLVKAGYRKREAGSMIILERFVGFYTLLCIAAATSFCWKTPVVIRAMILPLFLGYSVLMIVFIVYSLHQSKKVGAISKFGHFLLQLLTSSPLQIIYAFLCSILYQFLSIFISYYVAVSLGFNAVLLHYLTIVPLVWFATMVPISFGGVGVREISFVYLLSIIGYSQSEALAISLGTYLALVVTGIIGIIGLWSPAFDKKEHAVNGKL
jgi:uncharacterized membrane protein YbhN (UPF0104 family)